MMFCSEVCSMISIVLRKENKEKSFTGVISVVVKHVLLHETCRFFEVREGILFIVVGRNDTVYPYVDRGGCCPVKSI